MTREEVLDTAKTCVMGKREQDYGSPESNFQVIANFWSTYLNREISTVDVAMMMALLKISRIKNGGGNFYQVFQRFYYRIPLDLHDLSSYLLSGRRRKRHETAAHGGAAQRYRPRVLLPHLHPGPGLQ